MYLLMNNKMQYLIILLISVGLLLTPLYKVRAIAPPDIIYNIMQQLPQLIAMVFGFFSMISLGLYNYFKLFSKSFRFKTWQWVLIILILIIVSIAIAYLLAYVMQQNSINNRAGE